MITTHTTLASIQEYHPIKGEEKRGPGYPNVNIWESRTKRVVRKKGRLHTKKRAVNMAIVTDTICWSLVFATD